VVAETINDGDFFDNPNAFKDEIIVEEKKEKPKPPVKTNAKNDIIVEDVEVPKNEFADILPEEEEKKGIFDEIKKSVIDKQGEQIVTENGEVVEEKPKTVMEILKDRMFKSTPEEKKKKEDEKKKKEEEDKKKKEEEDKKKANDKKVEISQSTQDVKKTKKEPEVIVIKPSVARPEDKGISIMERIEKIKNNVINAFENVVEKTTTTLIFGSDKEKDKIEEIKNAKEKEKEKKKEKTAKEILLENEIDRVLNDILREKREIKTQDMIDNEKKYKESDEYKKFLSERELRAINEKEKIIIPKVTPKKKTFISYEVSKHPKEMLAPRSDMNKHISKLSMSSDIEKVLLQTIDYEMMPEFIALLKYIGTPNYMLQSGFTLLTYSVKYKKYKIVKYLLNNEVDVNKEDSRQETPIIIAVKNNDIVATEILIKNNVDLDKVDILKKTPLIYAIESDFSAIAIKIIDAGANVDIPSGNGEGTIPMAIRLGRDIIRQKLIKKSYEKRKNY
jgi:hypothetical protein